MKRLTLALLAWLALSASVSAQNTSPVIPATQASIAVTISTATTTLLIAARGTQSIYVTAVDIIAGGAGAIQFIAGTGATCAVSSVNITGSYVLAAQVGFTKGTGNGVVWVVPPGLSLCAVTTQAVGMPGSIAYAQF
jgi:hypothetical protein